MFKKECECRMLFRTAEDYRDHLPCSNKLTNSDIIIRKLEDTIHARSLEFAAIKKSAQAMSGALNLIDYYLGNTEGMGFNYEMNCDPHEIAARVKMALKPKHGLLELVEQICPKCYQQECPGAPRFKGICPKESKDFNGGI